jgi:hypothetical protein
LIKDWLAKLHTQEGSSRENIGKILNDKRFLTETDSLTKQSFDDPPQDLAVKIIL